MAITVVPYSADWPARFERLAGTLRAALHGVPGAVVEHVGSTAVPGLAAKPVLDVDVIVSGRDVLGAVAALAAVGYVHRGDLASPAARRSARRTRTRPGTCTCAPGAP